MAPAVEQVAARVRAAGLLPVAPEPVRAREQVVPVQEQGVPRQVVPRVRARERQPVATHRRVPALEPAAHRMAAVQERAALRPVMREPLAAIPEPEPER